MSDTEAVKKLFEEYLSDGKLLQLATARDGQPWVCSVWYSFVPSESAVVFLSRNTRRHVLELVSNPQVACSVVDISLDGLGQKVRGISFEGIVSAASDTNISNWYDHYSARWPQVLELTPLNAMRSSTPGPWLYIVRFSSGVLFDEVNFSTSPRQEWKTLAG